MAAAPFDWEAFRERAVNGRLKWPDLRAEWTEDKAFLAMFRRDSGNIHAKDMPRVVRALLVWPRWKVPKNIEAAIDATVVAVTTAPRMECIKLAGEAAAGVPKWRDAAIALITSGPKNADQLMQAMLANPDLLRGGLMGLAARFPREVENRQFLWAFFAAAGRYGPCHESLATFAASLHSHCCL